MFVFSHLESCFEPILEKRRISSRCTHHTQIQIIHFVAEIKMAYHFDISVGEIKKTIVDHHDAELMKKIQISDKMAKVKD